MRNQYASAILASVPPVVDAESGSVPVFWIYVDVAGRWTLRKEGGAAEATFASRAACLEFVRDLARNSPYRLFIETEDGRIVQELRNGRVMSPDSGNPKAKTEAAGKDDIRRRLEWADQLASEARTPPSRIGVLTDWLNKARS